MTTQPQLHWYDPAWQKQAHDWIRAEANRNSIQLTGEIEQPHAYAWSTVMRVPSSEGTLFFKATASETIYEIALTERMAGWLRLHLELVSVIKKYIALAHLQKPYFEVGTNVRLEVTVEHHRQHAPAKVVKLPFYEPEWKRK
ncbi:MAG: hypothetical protein AB1750_16710 [Chloroflexota bacterium]